nr:hypothetical protein DBT53_04440 [Aerococcus mictus]
MERRNRMKFLHLSDTHYLDNYQGEFEVFGIDYEPHEKLFHALETFDFNSVDFVVNTGDLIHDGGVEDYQALDRILRSYMPKDMPLYYVLGNHDNKAAFYQALYGKEADEGLNYVVDFQGYRLIILDTAEQSRHHGIISKELEAWLADQLAKPSEKGTLLFHHHPLLIGWEPGVIETEISDSYLDLLEASDVRGIFTGHLHENRHAMVRNIPQHTAASLAFGLEQVGDVAFFTDQLGYSVVEVNDETIDVFTKTTNPITTRYIQQVL